MQRRADHALRLAVATACVAAVSTACGSSGTGEAAGSSRLATSATSAADPGGAPADSATLAAISRAYATFFASTSTTAQSQATLQHGEKFTKALEEQAKSSYASTSSAAVDSARVIAPDVAAVTFTITSDGSALLSKVPGYAVRTGTTWQVAAQTFCGLLTLQGDAPAACDDAAVTALPD